MNITFAQSNKIGYTKQQPTFKANNEEDNSFFSQLNEPVLTIDKKIEDLSLQAFDAAEKGKYFESAGLKWAIGKIYERQGKIEDAEKANLYRDETLKKAFEKAEI